jgi:hypothetical protein
MFLNFLNLQPKYVLGLFMNCNPFDMVKVFGRHFVTILHCYEVQGEYYHLGLFMNCNPFDMVKVFGRHFVTILIAMKFKESVIILGCS